MIEGNKYKIKSIICNKQLNIIFHDNYESEISAELLRIESPSAEVQGHSKKEKITPLNKNVSIVNIEKVGNYAIRIIFDDGHDTGIYSWSYLRKVSENNIILYKEIFRKEWRKSTKAFKFPLHIS